VYRALYDKIYRKDVLSWTWSCCRANGGSSGVDGQSFEGIEHKGVEVWLEQLAQELRIKTYRPQAVRRVNIPKADGKKRPLGIPAIKDRVAQMAAVIVLEAILEADLTDEQYAYRPKRSAHDAVREVHRLLNRGFTEVVDADLSSYFDTIPHHELMQSVARRVSDRDILTLVKSWLEMPVEEEDRKGNKRRTTVNKDSGRGTPQGAPISPRFLLAWKQQGWDRKLQAHVVAAGTWQSLFRAQAKVLGFNQSPQQFDLHRLNTTLPQELLFRFASPPLILAPPSAEEFEAKILAIHKELRLPPPQDLAKLCLEGLESSLGFRWLEGYLNGLIIHHGLTPPPEPEEPNPSAEKPSSASALERIERHYGKKIDEL